MKAEDVASARAVAKWIRDNCVEDADPVHGFARASTKDVAEGMRIEQREALRVLNAAAKLGLLSKVGRIEPGRGPGKGFQGNVSGRLGVQLWEISFSSAYELARERGVNTSYDDRD